MTDELREAFLHERHLTMRISARACEANEPGFSQATVSLPTLARDGQLRVKAYHWANTFLSSQSP